MPRGSSAPTSAPQQLGLQHIRIPSWPGAVKWMQQRPPRSHEAQGVIAVPTQAAARPTAVRPLQPAPVRPLVPGGVFAPATRPPANAANSRQGRDATPLVQQCGWSEAGYEYPGNDLYTVEVPSADGCCQACQEEVQCLAWSWRAASVSEAPACFLKGNQPRPRLSKVHNSVCVSGRQTRPNASIQVIEPQPGQSLFCFSLVLPWGYERSLLVLQYSEKASIFGCDEYAVYSNESFAVAPAVETAVVASNLVAKKGGEFGTVLNTDVFLKVWARLAGDGRFQLHDWTVKVDPDAVFFPSRLRMILLRHHETERGTYLNNCKFGLHGPLEVFSRNAVKALSVGSYSCKTYFAGVCAGECKWGEDMFIDQCLMRVLKLNRTDEFNLLLEDHCAPPTGWDGCRDTTVASFHPFKTAAGYRRCLVSATLA